jgi:hypothetical protein
VDLLRQSEKVRFDDFLGQLMTITLELEDQTTRELNGLVTEIAFVGGLSGYVRGGAVLRPWLWPSQNARIERFFGARPSPTSQWGSSAITGGLNSRGLTTRVFLKSRSRDANDVKGSIAGRDSTEFPE